MRPRRSRSETDWPAEVTREWAWGGSTGKGVRVCILDSGVDADASARRPRRERGRRLEGRGRRRRSSPTTSRATSAATAPPAPGSSARSRRRPRSTASACSAPGFTGGGNILLVRPPLRDRAGLRRRQPEPLDDEEGLRRRPARARRLRLLPADGARRLGAQHAGRELSVALLVGDLRRQPRGGRPDGALLQPEPAGRVLRARASTSRSPGWAARRSAPPGTASRRRTSARSARSIRSKHPELTPFQLKSVLHLTSSNVGGTR